ncbi:hypothetical protein COU78_05575 [Candidatus Peregrinibacteria bacterium CG10_big_fil_rev_8_21_14_0_10_49_24]|nr:MAG: hypothetical protein COV83_03360 [Candidatus Peregrinibacteria bacterium CG11_big_fil_rev_8_21_14_0_20_49_14]PIR50597.1 MAG: hypothetical protein COU78_05575 [Candidatus Peregrinibacteria bacterium CG10_big_fil_rev_8_21_14_0_10_49_24]PJA67084.1 MAG: hypothetical protein CO157_06530 [Candidatus Peregrinibacteria bacterium CG_4_9_14_3_um_filter_49_12]
MENDGGLALKYLERKRREEFSPRFEQQVDVSGITALVMSQEEVESVDWDDAKTHLEALEIQVQ